MSDNIRIIRKRKKSHGTHHGGAWKVAYADFVTAMMAFFLVMWIVGLSQETKAAIAGYFKDPSGFMKAVADGKKIFGEELPAIKPGVNIAPELPKKAETPDFETEERRMFEQLKDNLNKVIRRYPQFKDLANSIGVSIASDGLRIDLFDSSPDLFFDSGSAKPRTRTMQLLRRIAAELGRVPNNVVIEGHTDSRPYRGPNGWTNWELSTARANAARSIMEGSGLRPHQMTEVRGLADTIPLDPTHRDSFKNRRVSILLPFRQHIKTVIPPKVAPDIRSSITQ